MTTLAKDAPRDYHEGNYHDYGMAVDIIYQGAAIGIIPGTGYAQPLTSSDKFGGFADDQVDNSSGSAGDKDIRSLVRGSIQLSVSGAVITDINQPVYATDDDTFVFLPTGGVFIGFVRRFVSSGVVVVEYDASNYIDPYGGGVYETYSASSTLDKLDTGKTFFVDTDAQTMTMLAAAVLTASHIKVVNIGAYGTIAVSIDPNASDLISGPDDTGADGGIMVNTKATAQRGDFVELSQTGDEGLHVVAIKGTWTIA